MLASQRLHNSVRRSSSTATCRDDDPNPEDGNVNEKRDGRVFDARFLLLIPATMMVIRHMRRRSMWHEAWAGGPAGRHGHHAWAGRPESEGGEHVTGFRLPPRIEATLNAWHERAHEADDAAEPPTA